MIKYAMAATVLKLFSTNGPTIKLYRRLGNTLGSKKRMKSDIPRHYIECVNRYLNLFEKYNVLKNGDQLLELGTGWLHWGATTMRLLCDIETTLFDIWDNRQFGAFKNYLRRLDEIIDKEMILDSVINERVHNLIRSILATSSFDDMYHLLNFKYVINPSGKLNLFMDESFDLIVSEGVLEHVKINHLSEYVNDFYRLLKPGGYSIHTINVSDHLSGYDKSVSKKNYLRYSDQVWQYFIENEVQYFNRVQASEWLALFETSRLKLIDKKLSFRDLGSLKINKKYSNLDRQDLECVEIQMLHRKPLYF